MLQPWNTVNQPD